MLSYVQEKNKNTIYIYIEIYIYHILPIALYVLCPFHVGLMGGLQAPLCM